MEVLILNFQGEQEHNQTDFWGDTVHKKVILLNKTITRFLINS